MSRPDKLFIKYKRAWWLTPAIAAVNIAFLPAFWLKMEGLAPRYTSINYWLISKGMKPDGVK